MNIFKREFKSGFKLFLIWTFCIDILIIGGMVKFSGVSGSQSGIINDMFSGIPKAVLAIFGMAEINIETLGGFYSVLGFYSMIAISFYAVCLGTGNVLRESLDKTNEFLFTKPCYRINILGVKMFSSFIFLTFLCILQGLFSFFAFKIYNINNTIKKEIIIYVFTVWIISIFFLAFSATLSIIISRAELAIKISYGSVLLSYGLSILFDADERFEVVRLLTPFKYFRSSEIALGKINITHLIVTIILISICLIISSVGFSKKDMI